MLIVDSAESIIQKRKSEPYSADQNGSQVTILGKMNTVTPVTRGHPREGQKVAA